LTIFYGFICFALYAVQSSSTQYKSLLHFLGGGEGGCRSLSMDSLLLSKILSVELSLSSKDHLSL
jgi:hypothetical protein